MDPMYGSALLETISHRNLYTRARATPEPLSTWTRAIPKSLTHRSSGPDSIIADPWIPADPEHGSRLFPCFYPWKLQANPYKLTTVNLFILRVLSFRDTGFRAWTQFLG